MSNLYLIASANGSGKTTLAGVLAAIRALPGVSQCRPVGRRACTVSETAAIRAGRLLLERIKELVAAKNDFGFETTLAGKSYVKMFKQMKEQGYQWHCYFLWLPSVEMAVARVAHRVSEGGHGIPEPTIRRRFASGLHNFFALYWPLFDSWILYNNSMVPPELIAFAEQNRMTVVNKTFFDRTKTAWSFYR